MHINLKLVIECASPVADLQITIQDRNNTLATVSSIVQPEIELDFKFLVPNQLTFVLTNLRSSVVLKKCVLGGLELTPAILSQICNFTPAGASDSIVTTDWWQDGKVVIDFFAGDWVQYHLLYGNKIVVHNT